MFPIGILINKARVANTLVWNPIASKWSSWLKAGPAYNKIFPYSKSLSKA